MTPDQRIDQVDDRINRLEGKLDSIDTKITALIVEVAKRHECPAPGSCIDLSRRVERLEGILGDLAKTVADLIRWRAWLTGVNLVISTISLAALAALGSYVVKHL